MASVPAVYLESARGLATTVRTELLSRAAPDTLNHSFSPSGITSIVATPPAILGLRFPMFTIGLEVAP